MKTFIVVAVGLVVALTLTVGASATLPPRFDVKASFHTRQQLHICIAGRTASGRNVLECAMPTLAYPASFRSWWMRGYGTAQVFGNEGLDQGFGAGSPLLRRGYVWHWRTFWCRLSVDGDRLRCRNSDRHGWSLSPTRRYRF
jgi:hypothetical protein